jgi:hypothetical protein
MAEWTQAGWEAAMFQRTSHRDRTRESERPGPPWRLLVESRDPALAISDFTAFRRAGFEITLCQGPLAEASECPLLNGEPCPLATDADVVLFDLGEDCADEAHRLNVLGAMRAFRPDLPIVVRSATPLAPEAAEYTIQPTTSVAGQVDACCRAARNGAHSAR